MDLALRDEQSIPKSEEGDLELARDSIDTRSLKETQSRTGDFEESFANARMKESLLKQRNFGVGGDARLQVWAKQMAQVEEKMNAEEQVLIAVVGSTGAGKSSLINALLGCKVTPTNAMRACTAVVTEISFHDKLTIEAEVEFLETEEWRSELESLMADLLDEEGNMKRISDTSSPEGVAWAKIAAVYPMLPKNSDFEDGLVRIIAQNSKEFSMKIAKFVDSKEKDLGKSKKDKNAPSPKKLTEEEKTELWPLIRKVKISIKADALSTGAVLVDLPGTADSNAARGTIAKRYLQKADGIIITAPQSRAVDDRAASELLGQTFKRQLQMDGNLGCLTFVTTKSDDLAPTEIIETLNLDMDDLDERLDSIDRELSSLRENEKILDTAAKTSAGECDKLESQLEDWEELREQKANEEKAKKAPPKGRKRVSNGSSSSAAKKRKVIVLDSDSDKATIVDGSGVDEDDGTADMTARQLAAFIKKQKATLKSGKQEIKDARNACNEARSTLRDAEAKKEALLKEKRRICALARNDYTRAALQEDFRAGLREMDDQLREEEEGDDFNPDEAGRDYDAILLPVFCISSREYMKLRHLVTEDGEARVFDTAEETGVPALQNHLKQSTVLPRMLRGRNIMRDLRDIAASAKLYLSSDGRAASEAESIQLSFSQEFATGKANLSAFLESLNIAVKKQLESRAGACFEVGCENASESSLQSIQEVGAMLPWQTYRATVRRQGIYHGCKGPVDMNDTLCQPVIQAISGGWERVFTNQEFFWPTFERELLATVDKIANTISASSSTLGQMPQMAARTLKDEISNRWSQQNVDLFTKIGDAQKDASRLLQTTVREALAGDYSSSAGEFGRGSAKRMKSVIETGIAGHKDEIFENSAKVIMERLMALADATNKQLEQFANDSLMSLKEAFAPLWEQKAAGYEPDQHTILMRAGLLFYIAAELERVLAVTAAMESCYKKHEEKSLDHSLEDAEAMDEF